jgi:type VI secretion system protein ImpF
MNPQLYEKLSRQVGNASMTESVANNLVDLMNCAIRGSRVDVREDSLAAASVLNYGIPPLSSTGSNSIDPMRVAAHLRKVVRDFEPRVDFYTTCVIARTDTYSASRGVLYFDVATTARTDGSVIELCLAFDYLRGHFMLSDN